MDQARQAGLLPERSAQAAIDSTGYESGHASVYYSRRSGRRQRHFPKVSGVCDARSHLFIYVVTCRGPSPDDWDFPEAVRGAFANQPFKVLLADAGYDAEHHHALVREELGARTIIPPTRGRPGRKPLRGRYRRMMARRFPRRTYGQRWQIESAFSQSKRRFGSALSAKNESGRHNQLRLRILAHNLAIILCAYPRHFNRA